MVKKHKSHISNRLLYTLITIGILAILIVGVYAFGAVPNPGHSLGQLQTCDSEGQTLVMQGGSWACAAGGTGGTSQWVTSGSDIYYTAGKVGIATNIPTSSLDIVGWLRSQGARINTLIVDNKLNVTKDLCLNGECRTSWPGNTYGAAPVTPNYIKFTTAGGLGISSDEQDVITNHFVWEDLYTFTRSATSSSQPYYVAPGSWSPLYFQYGTGAEYGITLDPAKGAVVGLRLLGSTIDDQGYCIAGFRGYFFIAEVRGMPIGNLRSLDLNGDFDFGNYAFPGVDAGPTKGWSWLISDLPAGDFILRDDNDYKNFMYVKAAGVNYVPPGERLVVKARYQNSATDTSSITCKVQVVYAPAL